jgi:hypothetical protein
MARTARKLLTLGLLGGGGSAPFSPLTIPGLTLWLDASDASTLFQNDAGTTPAVADGAVVGYWGDKSGSGEHATQATTGNKPILKTGIQNGKNVIRFDGTDDNLINVALSVSQPDTIFLVVSIETGDIYEIVLDSSGPPNRQYMGKTAVGGAYYMGADTEVFATAITAGCKIIRFVFNGASSAAFANAVSVVTGNAGTQSLAGLTVGRNSAGAAPFGGDISEILVYSGLLSASSIAAVEAYLNAKWAVY